MESKRSIVFRWFNQGLLVKQDAEHAFETAGVIPEPAYWRFYIRNLFLWLGGLAIAFSVMFFIAYNWDALGRFAKFGLIEALVAVCVIVYWRLKPDALLAKISLVMAAILLGVLLAFYGQTYQTGADPWQLFATWALLMLPWAIIARFPAMWILWIGLLNVTVSLYFEARGGLFWFTYGFGEYIYWTLFLLNAVIWILWEIAAKPIAWLQERWAVRLIAIFAGIPITTLACLAVFTHYSTRAAALLVFGVWLLALYGIYRKIVKDLFMLAGGCLSLIVFVTTFLGYNLLRNRAEMAAFFIISVIVIAMVAGAAYWLKMVYQEQHS